MATAKPKAAPAASPTTPLETNQMPAQTAQTALVATTPATTGQNALALPADLAAELAGYAKDAAAKERPSVSKISLKSGVISYAGQPVAGNNLDVIIIAAAYKNTLYKGRYDPNNITNPNCFAVSATGEDMAPHENVQEPENETCQGCPNSEWGSDPGGGRGKACKEGRRLILLPANALQDIEAIKSGEMAILDMPVTSVKNWSNLVNQLGAAGRPSWSVVVNVKTVPDAKSQFKVVLTPVQEINDVAAIQAIKARMNDALRIALTPYDETATAADAAAPAPQGKRKF